MPLMPQAPPGGPPPGPPPPELMAMLMGGGGPPGMGGPPPGPPPGAGPTGPRTATDKIRAAFDLVRDAYDDDPDDQSSELIVKIMQLAQKYLSDRQKEQESAFGAGPATKLLRRGG
jgi:hypothetical protein